MFMYLARVVLTNMRSLSMFLCFSLIVLSISEKTRATDQLQANDGVYIVYMGGKNSSNGNLRNDHAQLLSSLLQRKPDAVVHNYMHGFSGFAARLSEEEARSIAQKPGVVSVFPDPIYQLYTTHSWDFLKHQTERNIISNSVTNSSSTTLGSDTIIGFLDTGIWPESESFNDKGMGSIPSRWKGTCMEGKDFNSSNCNRKLIGARYYNSSGITPRDFFGHGSHVSAIGAGRLVYGASYYGLGLGTARGGSPGSRIAMYRVCKNLGCPGSAILAGFDDAIGDGVDILSISLGPAPPGPEFSVHSIAIGAFHAVENGITVVCAAGNSGPTNKTVTNDAPWITTVAATTDDRSYESNVVLGGNQVIKGGGINFANIGKSPVYPLRYESEKRDCVLAALKGDNNKKIILCGRYDPFYAQERRQELLKKGVMGMIFISDDALAVPDHYGSFPSTVVTPKDATRILSYINSTRNPTATVLATKTVTNNKTVPIIAPFSSRGPSYKIRNLVKPDIAAPGVAILAAWIGNDTSLFNVISGTSMATPHVSGIAATVKSQNPTWSPAAIRSAIMTTAVQKDCLGIPIATLDGSPATPYDFGAGEVSISRPTQPGLVYETTIMDYLVFMCNYGYNLSTIKLIASKLPDGFSCPKNSSKDNISNMNYPSIAISDFNKSKKIVRTVTNVGDESDDDITYVSTVDAPTGLEVKLVPEKLQFTKDNKELSFEVIFTLAPGFSPSGDMFGSITWSNDKYKVRSPFVVSMT